MKKNMFVFWVALICVALIIGQFGNAKAAIPSPQVTESITVDGSTTVFPVAQASAEIFTKMWTGTEINVIGSGSGTGISHLLAGTADIAMASRAMKDTEKASLPDWVETTVARDGIAIVVNTANTITSLTYEQIREIYNGTIDNWNEVGGADAEIVVVNREDGSGTRDFFGEEIMEGDDFRLDNQIEEYNSNGGVQTAVSTTPNAIGYVGLGYVTGLKVLGVAKESGDTPVTASIATVLDSTYPVARGLYMYTNGTATGLAKYFIDFIMSPMGQKIVLDKKYVNVADAFDILANPVDPTTTSSGTSTGTNTDSTNTTTTDPNDVKAVPGYTDVIGVGIFTVAILAVFQTKKRKMKAL